MPDRLGQKKEYSKDGGSSEFDLCLGRQELAGWVFTGFYAGCSIYSMKC